MRLACGRPAAAYRLAGRILAGVPAPVVRTETPDHPAQTMDQVLSGLTYNAFDYTI
jgi:hypothetical protein